MPKIAFIGAGSYGFTRSLVRDILTFPSLADSTLALMDINDDRLDFAVRSCQRIIDVGKYPAKIMATKNRVEELKDADAVVITILAGGVDVWRYDIEIPKQFGVDINVGDTRGVAGIFRALRTIPVMVDICRDVERYCPNAIVLNYTNPMAMLCRAMQKETKALVTGLCHSVQGTSKKLARWIGAPIEEIDYVCAGINHLSWFVKFDWNRRDAIPLIRKAVETRPEIYNEEQVRNEIFLMTNVYPTESSGHNSEYNWWFRKRPDLIEKYCTHSTGWNPGIHRHILDKYTEREDIWRGEAEEWINSEESAKLERGHEYAAYIINAYRGGEPYRFNGNVPNTQLVTNLPNDVCVEVPVFVDKAGLHSVHVGALPPQCAALTNICVASEEMAVEGCLTGNKELIHQAVAYDPLSAAVLSLAEIREMTNALFEKHKDYLPQFKI